VRDKDLQRILLYVGQLLVRTNGHFVVFLFEKKKKKHLDPDFWLISI
jgi:hypothetical protein